MRRPSLLSKEIGKIPLPPRETSDGGRGVKQQVKRCFPRPRPGVGDVGDTLTPPGRTAGEIERMQGEEGGKRSLKIPPNGLEPKWKQVRKAKNKQHSLASKRSRER